ncbi:MAG: PEP-CTERM sorting domain-containing protein [Burkholderiaceae bacterium]|jgi:hypothetical protein
MKRTTAMLAATAMLLPSMAQAGYNDPIVFGSAGTVTLTLDATSGAYDHVLELAASPGPIGSPPLMSMSSNGTLVVGGIAPTPVTGTIGLGGFAASTEIVFRLTNIGTGTFGAAGVAYEQVFTGASVAFNAEPSKYYSFVEFADSTTIHVWMEDLLPADPAAGLIDLDEFKDGADAAFTLTLTPVPEPGGAALLLAGLATVGWRARRRGR